MQAAGHRVRACTNGAHVLQALVRSRSFVADAFPGVSDDDAQGAAAPAACHGIGRNRYAHQVAWMLCSSIACTASLVFTKQAYAPKRARLHVESHVHSLGASPARSMHASSHPVASTDRPRRRAAHDAATWYHALQHSATCCDAACKHEATPSPRGRARWRARNSASSLRSACSRHSSSTRRRNLP